MSAKAIESGPPLQLNTKRGFELCVRASSERTISNSLSIDPELPESGLQWYNEDGKISRVVEEKLLELNFRVLFGRGTDVLDEIVVFSVEDAEAIIQSPEHDLAFEIMRYEWAQVLDENNRVERYFLRQNGKFIRSRGLELTLNPRPSKKKFKEYEIKAIGDGDNPVLKMKVNSEKLADALAHARSISKAFLEFRKGGQIKDFEFDGLEEALAAEAEGLPELKPPMKRTKEHPEELLRRARAHFKKSKFVEAVELFEEALPQSEELLDDLVMASRAALETHRFPIAEKFARRILSRHPKNPDAFIVLGRIYAAWQNFDEAVYYWKAALDQNPKDTFARRCYEQAVNRNTQRKQKTLTEDEIFLKMNKDLSEHEKRSWERRSCKIPIFIRGENFQEIQRYDMTSISAGGGLALLGENRVPIPEKFQFFINLPDYRTILGIGEKVYQTESGQIGLKFITMAPTDRALLNDEVMKLPK